MDIIYYLIIRIEIIKIYLFWNEYEMILIYISIYANVWLNILKCINIFVLKRSYENDFTLNLLFVSIIQTIWFISITDELAC